MAENLMVNAKTDILEFKRKHNLLVEKAIFKITVSNIKQLTNTDIENLSCGDVVLKEDESGKHAYLVSFKSNTGLCLTYCDASCVETQSYDKVGDNWVYNSEDKWEMTKPIYCHAIYWSLSNESYNENLAVSCLIFNNSPTAFTVDTFVNWMANLYTLVGERITILASGGKTLITEGTIAPMVRITKINAQQIYFTAKGVQSAPWTNTDAISSTTQFDDGCNLIN